MSTITGFNPEKARNQINKLEKGLSEINACFHSAHTSLFSESVGLHFVWCSPNAVTFFDNYFPKINDLYKKIGNEFNAINHSVKRAYNIIAARNNIGLYYNSGSLPEINYSFTVGKLLERHPNGAVGINAKLAAEVEKSYAKSMNECIDRITQLPTEISFYDDENAQESAYSINIEELQKEIITLFDEIAGEISTAIEAEVNNDMLAKQQVINTLNA